MKRSTDKYVIGCRQSNVRRVLPANDYCRTLFRCAQRFDYRPLGSSRKLGGAAEHLTDGNEKRICRLSYEFYSPRVVERRSKTPSYSIKVLKECSSTLPPPCE